MKYYQIGLTGKTPSQRYLSFEISFITKPTNEDVVPFLIQQTNSKPEVYDNGTIADPNDSISDMNGRLFCFWGSLNFDRVYKSKVLFLRCSRYINSTAN